MPEGCRKLVAWQVEKGKTLAIRKIVGRFDDDLDRRLSCVHSDGDFGISEIDLVAPSIGAPKDSVCHVRPLSGRNSREELCYSIPSPSSEKHPRVELQPARALRPRVQVAAGGRKGIGTTEDLGHARNINSVQAQVRCTFT